jgi:transposase
MARHRSHSIAFKRQIAQEFLAGETLHGFAKRHDISRNLIRLWVERYQAGVFDEDAAAADLLEQYEARIAALERLVGKQALELEFLKGALKNGPRPKSASTSAVVGPLNSSAPSPMTSSTTPLALCGWASPASYCRSSIRRGR